MIKLSSAQLRDIAQNVLGRLGLDTVEVAAVTDALVWADRRDRGPQGTIWLETVAQRVLAGGSVARAQMSVVEDQGARVILDAGNAVGHVAGTRAVELVAERVEQFGVGVVSVRNSSHFGACGYYAMRLAESGHLGIAATNAYPKVAPHGGRSAVLGTNPMAFAVPRLDAPPIVADLSTGAIAGSRIRHAQETGAQLPPDTVVDRDGQPTNDPDALSNGGVMLPVGGPKGTALGLMVEVLTSVVAGGASPAELGSMFAPSDDARTSHVVIAIGLADGAAGAVADLAGSLLGAAPRSGMEVRLPGDAGHVAAARDEIELDVDTVEALRRVAADLDVALPTVFG